MGGLRKPLAALAALVGLSVLPSCGVLGGGETYEVVAHFPRAVSLYEAGAVQVLGLPAGEVTDIEIVGDEVKVTMAIDADIPVPVDVMAALVPQSLIGERRIQLFPPYQEGDRAVQDGHVIGIEDTVVPVEPDEALAALKEFLDSLDPDGIGRLIDNAATSLDGQGENLGAALDELSQLVGNLEENDDEIIAIAERFDAFTDTLLTREAQLGEVLDDFAVVADVLAAERDDIERLITSLADLSGSGLDLVSEHAVRLRTDVAILSRLTRSIDTNLGAVKDALDAGPPIVDGFIRSYNPDLRALNLRNSFSPLLQEALAPIFDEGGTPLPCIPLDVVCAAGDTGGLAGDDAAPAAIARPTTPVDDVLALLGAPTAPHDPAPPVRQRSDDRLWSEWLGTFLGVRS